MATFLHFLAGVKSVNFASVLQLIFSVSKFLLLSGDFSLILSFKKDLRLQRAVINFSLKIIFYHGLSIPLSHYIRILLTKQP